MPTDTQQQMKQASDEFDRSMELGQRRLRRLIIGYAMFLALWLQYMAYALAGTLAVQFYAYELVMGYTAMIAIWHLGRVTSRNDQLVGRQLAIQSAYDWWLSAQRVREAVYYEKLTRQWLRTIGYNPPKRKYPRKQRSSKFSAYA